MANRVALLEGNTILESILVVFDMPLPVMVYSDSLYESPTMTVSGQEMILP